MLRSYKSTIDCDGVKFQVIPNEEFVGPEVIYKIRDWRIPFHKKILTRNEIFFASPLSFDDPLDCKLKIDFGPVHSSNSSQKLISNMMKRYPHLTADYIKDQLFRFIQDKQVYSGEGLGNNLYSKHMNIYFQRFGVFSATLNFHSVKMWEQYGGLEHGFCVGIKPSAMDSIIDIAGLVNYCSQLPMIPEPDGYNELAVLNLQFFSKEEKWSYEQEYRLAKRWDAPAKNSFRKQQVSSAAIKEVILAPFINPNKKDEVRSVLKSIRGQIKLYESIIISGKVVRDRELSY